MSKKSSFEILPQEMMDEIASNLAQKDLSSLSRTCQSIRNAVEKKLYQTIDMLWEGNAHDCRNKVELQVLAAPRIDLLLRTILETPRYAEYITAINLQAEGCRSSRYHWFKPSLPPPVEQHSELFKGALRRTGMMPMSEEVERGLEENNLDAVVGLFLLVTPKISSLTLGLDLLRGNHFLSGIFRNLLSAPLSSSISSFSALTYVNLGVDPDIRSKRGRAGLMNLEKALDVQSYLPIFYIPTLENALISLPNFSRRDRGDEPFGKNFEWPIPSQPCHAPALKSLKLPMSFADPILLQKVLSCTPSLVRLEYDCAIFRNHVLEADDLQPALETIKATLAHLKICFTSLVERRFKESPRYGVNDRLHLMDFQALKTLDIVVWVLLGDDPSEAPGLGAVLPPSLTSLRLRGHGEGYQWPEWHQGYVARILEDFVEDGEWGNVAPQLEHLDLVFWDWEERTEEDGNEKLQELCARKGLKCRIADNDEAFEEAYGQADLPY